MDYVVVANSAAGSAQDEAVDAAVAALEGGAGSEVERVRCGDPSDLEGVLDRLDGRVLVMAGGDGSLHLAVNRVGARGLLDEVTFGLVPLGTGNDLARGLGIPLDPAEAGAALAAGRARRLDVVVADDGTHVVNAAHAGLGAEAAEQAGELKDRFGPAAYPLGALKAGVTADPWDLRIEVDGEVVHEGTTLLVGVGIGTSIGGGTPLTPDASFDDGVLDVVVATAADLGDRAAFALALRKGTHGERPDVVTARGTEVRISGTPVRHNTDGELTDELAARTYTLHPAAWQLVL